MNPVSILVRELHVDYEVFAQRRASLRGLFVERKGQGRQLVHAIRGIDLTVRRGDAVGVIGSNGSGKSTLLSALAGLQPATSGEILVQTEPKLLGVGAILLPRSTGRRNIRLGCLALGMPADELDSAIEQIIDFTELGEAIDRPLQTYSAGMRARLHFAISTATRPEILLIDEALAVGDKAFRDKSRERIEELLDAAGTLMLVSHSTAEIRAMCNRVVWVEKGVLRADGPVNDVVGEYEEEVIRRQEQRETPRRKPRRGTEPMVPIRPERHAGQHHGPRRWSLRRGRRSR